MATIEKMTYEELQRLIDARIDERLTALLGKFELEEDERFSDEESDEEDNLTWDEIRGLVERHRWTPPPGAKSSLKLLREDRDS
jgi:hypothetical protein